MLLVFLGLVAIASGVVLARQGYARTRKRPYPSLNVRLSLGAVLIGIGLALVLLGTVEWIVFS